MNPDLVIDLSTQHSHDGKLSKMDSAVSISLRLFLFGFINSDDIVADDYIRIRDRFSVGAEESHSVAAFGVSVEVEIKKITAVLAQFDLNVL